MKTKNHIFSENQLKEIIKKYPTPFHIYDEKGIRENARKLNKIFSWADDFKEYFALKATPNPHILKILKDEGFGSDCSSLTELLISEKVGLNGNDIMFTSNDTPLNEYQKANDLNAIINLDDISHIDYIEKHIGISETICFRYNPGKAKYANMIIGTPEEAKYGLTKEQLFESYKIMKNKGVKRFGLHTMLISNELIEEQFIETAKMLFDIAIEINNTHGIKLDFINFGGGIGIPYKPEDKSADLEKISEGIRQLYIDKIVKNNLNPIKIFMECGRMITGPYGYVVSQVLHKKNTYKQFVGLDSCMADLMRPALYDAYHHISVLGKENDELTQTYDITGSLCENNDKFAIDRKLPNIDIGDIIIMHDTGAHGHAMGFNYNGKLRSAELLLKEDGNVKLIRRAETVEDYFATLDF